jgi:hypothetical protein
MVKLNHHMGWPKAYSLNARAAKRAKKILKAIMCGPKTLVYKERNGLSMIMANPTRKAATKFF